MSAISATPSPTSTDLSSSATATGSPPTPNSGPQNSPLLFFVALGFGVVFTNLWIIVGVKYCFRYNARNRARQHDENGEPIDLAAMPQRRRRREKKLMTMDEVNGQFPITKYKTWVSTRAAQGLPTEGGVSQSRAASIKDAEGVIAPIDALDTLDTLGSKKSAEIAEPTAADASSTAVPAAVETHAEPSTFAAATAGLPVVKQVPSHAETADEDDDEAIPPAVPGASEMLTAPGDTCAICIDTLEDDDDVRGLTCGHAFHASCLDPWLTSRRACCPLCKADYYVPKPRPEGVNPAGSTQPDATPADGTAANPFGAANGAPQRPSQAASAPAGGISRYIPRLTGRVDLPPRRQQTEGSTPANAQNAQNGTSFASLFRRSARNETEQPAPQPAPAAAEQPAASRRWAPSIPNWRRRGEQTQATATPSQLEAGNSTSA